jgi:hypothetical protein
MRLAMLNVFPRCTSTVCVVLQRFNRKWICSTGSLAYNTTGGLVFVLVFVRSLLFVVLRWVGAGAARRAGGRAGGRAHARSE